MQILPAPRPGRRQFLRIAIAAAAGAACATPQAKVAGYPGQPLRLVVPFAAGGPTDLMARAIGKEMTRSLGQPVVVENKPGGGGLIGLGEVAKAPADGLTIVFPSILAVTNPALMPRYPYDTARDFAPVTVVGFIPHVLVVRQDAPARTLADLIAAAKARPGTMNYASSGSGTSAHLAGALFAEAAGIRLTHVPYRGAGPALGDLLGGQVQMMFLDAPSALPQLRAGKLRALAVASGRRLEALPQVPTVAEQGFPGYEVHGWYGLLVRAGTPAAIVETLYGATRDALAVPSVQALFAAAGIAPGGMPPAAFGQLIRSDLAMWKATVERLHITLD